MLVTITRPSSPKRFSPGAPLKTGPYAPYEPYKPYRPAARQRYQGYQPYKPYGHPDHPFKPKKIEDIEQEMTLRDILHKNRLALPEFSFVKAGHDKVIIEIEPHDVQALLDVMDAKNLKYSMDDDELPKSCQYCGTGYTDDEAKKGLCPHCFSVTCDRCGESFNSKRNKRCPHCKNLPDLPDIV
jgi:hypothetical protein